jgi:hypothetical protein
MMLEGARCVSNSCGPSVRKPHEKIAYHEAGHAIMAMACGFVVTEMSAAPSDFGRGHVAWGIPDPPDDQMRRLAVLTLAAGMAADLIHWGANGSEDEVPEGYLNDRRQAGEHLAHVGEEGAFFAYAITAANFLKRAEVWEHVEFVAKLLLKGGRINGHELIGRIAESCPKVDDAVFQFLNNALDARRRGLIPD